MPVLAASSNRQVEPRVAAPWGGTVLLLMLVVAMGHFNRIAHHGRPAPSGSFRSTASLPASMGMVYSAFLMIYTLAMLPGGWFIDRFGARAALVLLGFSSTIFVALTGAVGLVAHEEPVPCCWASILVRGLLGLTNAPLHPASARMVFDQVPAGREASRTGWSRSRPVWEWPSVIYAMGALIDLFDWPIAFVVSSGLTLFVASGVDVLHATVPRAGRHDQPDRPASSDLTGLVASDSRPERGLHHTQLRGLWLFPVPLFLLDRVLLRGDSASGCRGVR